MNLAKLRWKTVSGIGTMEELAEQLKHKQHYIKQNNANFVHRSQQIICWQLLFGMAEGNSSNGKFPLKSLSPFKTALAMAEPAPNGFVRTGKVALLLLPEPTL